MPHGSVHQRLCIPEIVVHIVKFVDLSLQFNIDGVGDLVGFDKHFEHIFDCRFRLLLRRLDFELVLFFGSGGCCSPLRVDISLSHFFSLEKLQIFADLF